MVRPLVPGVEFAKGIRSQVDVISLWDGLSSRAFIGVRKLLEA